ncbi:uncharacterized protein LOC122530237 isoform X1 [Frieseomelitta varia]|uniref:uncharacterized protein LOC122530237 isoform X1 n=2 Tax=Frieseomelitta varia TaxID=561572 RepID=UPI001CB6AD36|nr:uncharacterized protein LOC122530237 isoform X1 [Frieseomelitta varia]
MAREISRHWQASTGEMKSEEMPLCSGQQQDFEETDLSRKEDTLQGWAGKSVWSMVCAMELGLISSVSQNNVLHDTMPDERSYVNVAGVAVPKSTLPLINNSSVSAASKSSRIRLKSRRRKKKRSSKCASRSKSESPFIRGKEVKENFCKTRRSYDSTTMDNDLNTVDKFWRYQKRRHEGTKNAEQFPCSETRNDDPSVSAGYRDSLAAKRDDNDNLPNQSNHTANILPTRVNIPQTGTSSREVKSSCRNDAGNIASRGYDRSAGNDRWTRRTDFKTSSKPVNVRQKRMVDRDEDKRLRYSREDRNDDHQGNVSVEPESEESSKEQSENEEDLALDELASLDEAESSNFGAARSSNSGDARSSSFREARPSSFGGSTLLNFDEARSSSFNEPPSPNLDESASSSFSEMQSSNLDETASTNFGEARSLSFGREGVSLSFGREGVSLSFGREGVSLSFDDGRSSNFSELRSSNREDETTSSNFGDGKLPNFGEAALLSFDEGGSSNFDERPSNFVETQSTNFDGAPSASSNGEQPSKLDIDELSASKKVSSNEESEDEHSIAKKSKMSSDENTTTAKPMRKVVKAPQKKGSRWSDGCYELRRVTRGSMKVSKDLFVGKLVWGYYSGWWPALIVDADHVGMLPETEKLWVYWIGEARISSLNEKTQIEPFSSNLESRLTKNLSEARVRAIDAAMQMLRGALGCTLTKPYFTWIENNFPTMIEMMDELKFYPYPNNIQRRLDTLRQKNAKITEKYLLDQKRESQGKKVVEKPKEVPQRNNVDLTRLPLQEQNPGIIAWAKIAGHNWWPAMIIDYRDCCMREPSFGCQWIMWYGDYQLSEVHHQLFMKFDKGIEKMRDYINNTKKHLYMVGVLQASKDYCSRIGLETKNWTLDDALKYFSKAKSSQASSCDTTKKKDSVKIYDKYSACIAEKLIELKKNTDVDDERTDVIKNSDDLRSAMNGNVTFKSLCLRCLKVPKGKMDIHPFFEGSLCRECSDHYKPCMFLFGNDSKCFYCTVCAASGTMIICDKEDCPRVYCTACMKHLLCPTTYEQVLREDPWECFLCAKSQSFTDSFVKPRTNWKAKIISMFRTNFKSNVQQLVKRNHEKKKIRVLSLFDGLSTGLLVLLKLGIAVDKYYASEIDPDALMVSATHFGDRVIHLGNVKGITKEKIKEIAPIDLLIGGSPCNDLSLANPARLGLHDPKGTGVLFFEYSRILDLVKKINNKHHLFWFYENVASMPTEYRLEINKHLGQEPDTIDSADFSPQHRLRLYWHNLPLEPHSLPNQEQQDVQDILTPHCQRYSLVKKIRTVTTKVNSLKQGKLALKPILMKDETDSLWITELEEIFGFPRHYTDVKNLSATKRQKLIGKSWSVQTLTAIFRSLCPFFECNTTETNRP